MIVLDASVLIAYLDGSDAHHRAARDLLAANVAEELGVNQLTLAEVLVAPMRAGRLAEAEAAVRDLGIRELPFSDGTSVRLARLRVETGLKMPDCCVLLAAENGAARVATFDNRLADRAQARSMHVVRA